jgi:two-component system, NtrC family, response regulator AtoC
MQYHFPGDIRKLKAAMDLVAVLSNGEEVSPEDLSFSAAQSPGFFLHEEKTLKDYNTLIIQHFLKKYDNNVLRVTDKLDIGKSTIYKMIQQKELTI